MKLTKKILLLISTILITASLSACIVVPSDSASSTQVTPEVYDVNVNSQTVTNIEYSSLVEMLDDVRPSVVEIYTQSSNAIGTGAGSGIIVSKKIDDNSTAQDSSDDKTYYFILTCHHVIDGTDNFVVKDIDGNQFSASLIGGDPNSDIAVLRIMINNGAKNNLSVANTRDISADKNPLKVGEEVVAIGNPLGTLGGTVTKGIISSTDRTVSVEGQEMELIQTDCSINSGNSGGGLFDMQGRLVGVVNAGYTGLQGLNFAIPVDDSIKIFESLLETYYPNYGYVEGRANVAVENAYNLSFGYEIAFADYSTNVFNYYTYIMEVKETSAYYKAGLRAGDYVTAVSYKGDKREVSGAASSALVSYLKGLNVSIGDQITFTVVRSGVKTDYTVTYTQFIYGDNGQYR